MQYWPHHLQVHTQFFLLMKVFPQEYVLELVIMVYIPQFDAKSLMNHTYLKLNINNLF